MKSLWKRSERNCSNPETLRKERNHLKDVFDMNGYPKENIRKWTSLSAENVSNENSSMKFVSIPYIRNVSETAARLFREGNVFVGHKPSNTLRNILCKVKDSRPKEDSKGCVYSVQCNVCPASYVGESKRKLSTRIAEHRRAVNREDQLSHIYQHQSQTGHLMDLTNPKILYKEPIRSKRLFLEAFATNRDCINRCTEINPVYRGLR